jgi:hypothetical protein
MISIISFELQYTNDQYIHKRFIILIKLNHKYSYDIRISKKQSIFASNNQLPSLVNSTFRSIWIYSLPLKKSMLLSITALLRAHLSLIIDNREFQDILIDPSSKEFNDRLTSTTFEYLSKNRSGFPTS